MLKLGSMKWLVLAVWMFAGGALVASECEAARMGGGRSMGIQRSVTRPPSAVPARPSQPAQSAPAQAAPGQPAQPAPSGLSRWLPLLGGLAIGGLLGSLFGGSGLGGILLLALLVLITVVAVKALTRPRSERLHYEGFGGQKVTLPLERPAGSADVRAPQSSEVPAGFDTASFLKGAKLNFIKLQAANDAGDLAQIREFTTTEMFDELSRAAPAPGQHTDVISLEADLLQVATEGERHWASVRFSGTLREATDSPAEGFEEVWNLVKPVDGTSGWLLAGIQQSGSQ